MIKSFNKEEFMSQPVQVEISQEESYAYDTLGNTIAAFPTGRTVVINVGGEDYDVRDLVWRLKCAEANIDDVCERLIKLDRYCHDLDDRLARQENRIF